MHEEIKNFGKWLSVNGYAYNTRRDYTQRIRCFFDYADDVISKETVEDYLLSLQERFKNKTINCYRDAICAFLNFKNLEIKVPKKLKEEITIPDSITMAQFIEEVLPVAEADFKKPEKVAAILCLLIFSGLRRSEICLLKRKNIDLDNLKGKVFVPKINQWREFFFDELASDKMMTYFMSENEGKNAFNIGRGGINNIFKKLKNNFKDIKIRPHLMRHSCATGLLKDGVNLKYIQAILGHRSLRSTERYLKVDNDDVQKKYLESVRRRRNKIKRIY